jgi:hypothetical protein
LQPFLFSVCKQFTRANTTFWRKGTQHVLPGFFGKGSKSGFFFFHFVAKLDRPALTSKPSPLSRKFPRNKVGKTPYKTSFFIAPGPTYALKS